MMAHAPNTSFARIFAIILLFLVTTSSSTCADGNYTHEGRQCCLCAVGQRVSVHCLRDGQYGKCEPCEPEKYSSVPGQDCEDCTSCSHINANQVENTPCTSARDRTCRCEDDHFCSSSTGICTVCNPCTKCGAEGIKVACKGNNDTVCNEKNEGNSHVGIAIGIVVAALAIIAIGAGVFLYKKRKEPGARSEVIPRPRKDDDDAPFIPDEVDLEPHFPDLVKVIGWKDMRDIALHSGIPNARIESCQLNHPGDANEQTLQLLQIWNEKQGRKAGNKLKQMLQDIDKKKTAQDVTNILLRSARNNSPV